MLIAHVKAKTAAVVAVMGATMVSASNIPVVVAAAAAIEMTESSITTVLTAAVVVITGQRAGRKEG